MNSSAPEQQEKLYYPLLTILHAEGYHDLVEDYATQYNYNYPTGEDKIQIMLIHLKSLIADGKNSKALDLLSGGVPKLLELEEIAASLYFGNHQFSKTIDLLLPYLAGNQLSSDDEVFMLAESFFQNNQVSQAEPLFLRIKNNDKFHDQACYRLSMIARQNGNKEESLKLLSEIVEEGNDPLWQKLAIKDREFQQLMIQ
jgi:tetratricopeptide (TPR) repeat protein